MRFPLHTYIYIVVGFLLLNSCAQIGPLTGGPKDKTPPKLLQVLPKDSSINVPVKNTKIVFTFDEMIDVKSVSSALTINPFLGDGVVNVSSNQKKMTITFEQDLQPNTTYKIQFGNSVADIHESNKYKNLTYLFSTGASIDTNVWSGSVIWAQTLKSASGVWIELFTNTTDTAVTRTSPMYMIKADSSGAFSFSNLKPGTYQAFAITDKNKNHNYDLGEGLAFLNKAITIPRNESDTFLLSTPKTDKVFITKKNQFFWGYNKYQLNDTLPDVYILPLENNYGSDTLTYETINTDLNVYYKGIHNTKLKFIIKRDTSVLDTVQLEVPGQILVDSLIKRNSKRMMGIVTDKQTYGVSNDDVYINFSQPIMDIDLKKCYLIHDSIKEKVIYTNENKNEEGRLVTTYLPLVKRRLLNKLKEGKDYKLVFLPTSYTSFWGLSNTDTITVSFKTYLSENISTLKVNLTLFDSIQNYILQLTDANGKLISEYAAKYANQKSVTFYNLQPADYSLRLIDDKDGNQKFSAANISSHTQPEKIYLYNKILKVPAGWDVEQDWNFLSPIQTIVPETNKK